MNAPEASSTRPYLLRALFEWCTDNGFTPHIAVRVDRTVQVPMEFVRNGEIVLNISYDATSGLLIGNEYVEFKARFGGKPREIMVPIANVMAIYARETGQGMAFPPEEGAEAPEAEETLEELVEVDAPDGGDAAAQADERVVQLVTAKSDDDEPRTPPPAAPAGGRPALKRVK
jgi:stringent starvation protein B